jgi:hypothetical protein
MDGIRRLEPVCQFLNDGCCQVVGVYIPPFLLENSVPTGSLRRHEEEISCGQTVFRETVGRCLRLHAWVIDRVEVIRALVRSLWLLNYDRVKEKTVVETVSARLVVSVYDVYKDSASCDRDECVHDTVVL